MTICGYRDYLLKYIQDNKGLQRSVVEGLSTTSSKFFNTVHHRVYHFIKTVSLLVLVIKKSFTLYQCISIVPIFPYSHYEKKKSDLAL